MAGYLDEAIGIMAAKHGAFTLKSTTFLQPLCPMYHDLTRFLGQSTRYNVTMNRQSIKGESGVRHETSFGET